MSPLFRPLAILLCVGLAACLATSPESAAEEALGGEILGLHHGPLHRPGQPCLVCHGENSSWGRNTFEIAGTVFERAADKRGPAGVEVVLTDVNGNEYVAKTNKTGNFFVTVDSGASAPSSRSNGELVIPKAFAFPLHVKIRSGSNEQKMHSLVWRNSSCADCHRGPANDLSNGPIYMQAEAP